MARTTKEKKSEHLGIPITPRLKDKLLKLAERRSKQFKNDIGHTEIAREFIERGADQELATAGK